MSKPPNDPDGTNRLKTKVVSSDPGDTVGLFCWYMLAGMLVTGVTRQLRHGVVLHQDEDQIGQRTGSSRWSRRRSGRQRRTRPRSIRSRALNRPERAGDGRVGDDQIGKNAHIRARSHMGTIFPVRPTPNCPKPPSLLKMNAGLAYRMPQHRIRKSSMAKAG